MVLLERQAADVHGQKSCPLRKSRVYAWGIIFYQIRVIEGLPTPIIIIRQVRHDVKTRSSRGRVLLRHVRVQILGLLDFTPVLR